MGRTFTQEFKLQTVKLASKQGKSLAEDARDPDLGESMLRAWKAALSRTGDHAFPGKRNPPALEEELRRRRAENKRLTMERGISKNATALCPGSRHEGRLRRTPPRSMVGPADVPGPARLARDHDDWRGRPRSNQAAGQDALVVAIKAVHGEVKARCDSPRIHAELDARGETCCMNTVAWLMYRERPALRTASSRGPVFDRSSHENAWCSNFNSGVEGTRQEFAHLDRTLRATSPSRASNGSVFGEDDGVQCEILRHQIPSRGTFVVRAIHDD